MKRGLQPQGFTIVETLIFLAVSGGLLLSAFTLMGGTQRKAQFTAAVNDANEQITQVINNVSNGYYPAVNDECVLDGSGELQFTGNTTDIGVSKDCVYLGRAIEFTNDDTFTVYNIVGVRTNSEGNVNTSVAGSFATAIRPEVIRLKNGLRVEEITSGANDISSIGFFTSLGEQQDGDSRLTSGALNADFLPIDIGSLDVPDELPDYFLTTFRDDTAYENQKNPNDGIRICLRSGSNDEVGILTIGGEGRTATTSLVIQGEC